MNATDSVRILARFEAGMFDAEMGHGASSSRFELTLPVRSFLAWPGKRNYEGSWWSNTVRAHVAFESLLEREFLMTADHDRDVLGIVSQPFALLWPKGTEGARGHVPDYFVRLADGSARVVDVRHPKHLASAERQFEMTREVCGQIGWAYEVFTGLMEPLASNLRWLSGYRQDRFIPPHSIIPVILEEFTPAVSLAAGVRRAARKLRLDPTMVHAHALHLLFAGALEADLGQALSSETIVVPAREPASDAVREAVS